METKDVLFKLRTDRGLSQDELAGEIFVTRQAVSRWENGETVPNTETLKLLSRLFNVSINTLLGSPRQLVCQCCGMPLEDLTMSRETDGTLNEEYCKWCYADGKFTYTDPESLIEFCVGHMSNESWPETQVRAYFEEMLPKLQHWQKNKKSVDHELLKNLDKLHTTELGEVRIKRNLSLDTDCVVDWCAEKISSDDALITRRGKNWYVQADHRIITVNAHSYTIITAHRERQ